MNINFQPGNLKTIAVIVDKVPDSCFGDIPLNNCPYAHGTHSPVFIEHTWWTCILRRTWASELVDAGTRPDDCPLMTAAQYRERTSALNVDMWGKPQELTGV